MTRSITSLLILILTGILSKAICQSFCDLKYDYVWIMGDVDVDTILNEYGGCEINFNNSPISFEFHPKSIENPFQNGSICSKSGDLLFYSNGCTILNKDDAEIQNGDSLNPGEIYNQRCPLYGYLGLQNMLFIPDTYNDSIYYLFHIDIIYNRNIGAPFVLQPEHLYCTTINAYADSGKGKIVRKNEIIIQDTSMLGDPLTAVKHANGLDWWLITPNRWTNSFNRILLDRNGPHFEGRQYIGFERNPYGEGGQGKFSPDGSHFAWYHPIGGLFLYDFNRKTGLLSNFKQIDTPQVDFISGGCEFSPSGRFLYVNHDTSLYQLDVLSPDIQASLTHIADFDGFADDLPTFFYIMERTPDKRIIMNVLNGSQYLHVIQEPDKKGLACRFEQHAIKLPTINNFTLPHFPNYRLGALGDTLCDTLSVSTLNPQNENSDLFRIVPNPASEIVSIIPVDDQNHDGLSVSFFDLLGHQVKSSDLNNIDVRNLPAGIYILRITTHQKILQLSRLVISKE